MFLEAVLKAYSPGTFPRSLDVEHEGWSRLYVRVGARLVDGEVREPVVTLANIEASEPGSGALTRLVGWLRSEFPSWGIYVENAHNPRLGPRLEALGFARVNREEGPNFILWADRGSSPTML